MENENKTPETNEQKPEVTLPTTPEELQALLQKEGDRRVTSARQKFEVEYEKKLQLEKEEAAKLAKLNAVEREKALFQKEKEKFEIEMKQFQRTKMELETSKILGQSNIPIDFAKYLLADDAETVNKNIEDFKSLWEKSISDAVDSKLKKNKLPGSQNNPAIDKNSIDNMSITEMTKLFHENPTLWNELNK